MIRGVIFDLDGVLVSTDEFHYQAWKRLANEEGIPFDDNVNHRLRGVSRMASLEIILEKSPKQYSQEEKIKLAERKNSYYCELLQKLNPDALLPGSLETVQRFTNLGIKTAIGSSSKNAKFIMKRIGLAGKIDVVVDGNDITNSKPHPEVFLLAATRMGLSPSQCLVIEDAEAGVEAARRAGMVVLGIGTRERLKEADHVVGSLLDMDIEACTTEKPMDTG